MVDASDVVYFYFRRWPAEELWFKNAKASVSLNRVCGYGKKLVENERVKESLAKLVAQKEKLEHKLEYELSEIAEFDRKIQALIKIEREMLTQCRIKDGQRHSSKALLGKIGETAKDIRKNEMAKKKVEASRWKEFKAYRRTAKQWLALQNKTTVYQLDVELDQIVTYFRASLAHLCAYFIHHFLNLDKITFVMLFHRINQLQAKVKLTKDRRHVTLTKNFKDPEMMILLARAIEKLNNLSIRGDRGRVYYFSLK
jgi:hypothetical protein